MKNHRETLEEKLPSTIQFFISWITGIALESEKGILRSNSFIVFCIAVFFILIGFNIIMYSIETFVIYNIPLYILGAFFVASGMRRLDVLLIHQSLHYKITKNTKLDTMIGELLSVLLIRMPFKENRIEHLKHHRYPCTYEDGDALMLIKYNLNKISNPRSFYMRVLLLCISPMYHFDFLKSRVNVNFKPSGGKSILPQEKQTIFSKV